MNSVEVESKTPQAEQPTPAKAAAEAPLAPVAPSGLCGAAATCKSADTNACESVTSGSGGCSASNYTAKAFFIPFLAVTAYSVIQGNACAATAGHACTASAVAVGTLAGLTSVALVKVIKALRTNQRNKSAKAALKLKS